MGSFKKATKQEVKLRLALIGPSGSGKTYSALRIASALDTPVFVIDSERGSSQHYSDVFDFEVATLTNFAPREYIKLIKEAEQAGAGTIIIDSASHAWIGAGGALDQVDKITARQKGNSYTAWRTVTPQHNELVDAIIQCNAHIITTMRAKTKYVMDEDEKGKTRVRKLGLEAVQRDGLEYEFDVVGDIDLENNLVISKTRCAELNGAIIHQPGEELAATLLRWMHAGARPQPVGIQQQQQAPEPQRQQSETSPQHNDLAAETKTIFDDFGVDAPGRRYAFDRIKKHFNCSTLDEIPAASRKEYLELVRGELRDELIEHGYVSAPAAAGTPESGAGDTTSDVSEPPAVEASSEPDPEIVRLVGNLPKILKAYRPADLDAAVAMAQQLLCKAWEVDDATQIPGSDVEILREHLKTTMIDELRESGHLPPAEEY